MSWFPGQPPRFSPLTFESLSLRLGLSPCTDGRSLYVGGISRSLVCCRGACTFLHIRKEKKILFCAALPPFSHLFCPRFFRTKKKLTYDFSSCSFDCSFFCPCFYVLFSLFAKLVSVLHLCLWPENPCDPLDAMMTSPSLLG